MAKTIVTHLAPDLDGMTAAWLLRKYLPHWGDAELVFVPANTTLGNKNPDDDPDIIHVDTGGGRFDHHDTNERTCAAALVYRFLNEQGHLKEKDLPSLERIIEYVTKIDHFEEVRFPEPDSDLYDFCIHQLTHGLRAVSKSNAEFSDHIFALLDAAQTGLKLKMYALRDIENGIVIKTPHGKAIAMESKNEESIKLALKKGFVLALRKDPQLGYVKCKSFPDTGPDLAPLYKTLKQKDPSATWYLHPSHHIIINGSSMNPDARITTLDLPNLVAIIRSMK